MVLRHQNPDFLSREGRCFVRPACCCLPVRSSPDPIRPENLVRPKRRLILHRPAALHPIAEIVISHAALYSLGNFPECSICSETAFCMTRVKVEIHAAQPI